MCYSLPFTLIGTYNDDILIIVLIQLSSLKCYYASVTNDEYIVTFLFVFMYDYCSLLYVAQSWQFIVNLLPV